MTTLQRTIHLFRASITAFDGTMVPDPLVILRAFAALPYRDAGMCRRRELGAMYHAGKLDLKPGVIHGRFGAVKLTDLPMKMDADENEEELVLGVGEGLDFACHFNWYNMAVLPNKPGVLAPKPYGLLVWEHNQQAPRVTGFASYLTAVFGDAYRFEFVPIADANAWDKFNSRSAHKSVTVKIARERRIDGSEPTGRIQEFFRSAWPDTEEIEITFKPKRRHFHRSPSFRQDVLSIAGQGNITKLQVGEEDGQVLDLLAQKIRYSRTVRTRSPRSRSVDPAVMHQELHDVFQLERARVAEILGRVWVPGRQLGAP